MIIIASMLWTLHFAAVEMTDVTVPTEITIRCVKRKIYR